MRETRLWSLHILVIPIIAVLLGMHFAVMHYAPVFYGMSVEKAREFSTMIERGKSVSQFVIYMLLLVASLFNLYRESVLCFVAGKVFYYMCPVTILCVVYYLFSLTSVIARSMEQMINILSILLESLCTIAFLCRIFFRCSLF